ncbi:hypothetical protein ACSSZE_17100 [Acidithiobacillus caldus]
MRKKHTDPGLESIFQSLAQTKEAAAQRESSSKALPLCLEQIRALQAAGELEAAPKPSTAPTPTGAAVEPVAPAPLPTAESPTPKKTGRPRKYDPSITPADRARLSRQRRAEQIAQALTTGDLRDVDDKTLAALLSRAIGNVGQRQRVRNYLQELNRRFGV